MNNKEFLDILMTCTEIRDNKDISIDKMINANIDLSETYKILKRFGEKHIDDKDSFRLSLWTILGHISNMCYGHYYDGDYNDIVKAILNRFSIIHKKGATRKVSHLVFDFFISNLNKPYELKLRDFNRCFVDTERLYEGHELNFVNNGGKDTYILLDHDKRCSVCFIKDGKLNYKPYTRFNYSDNIDFMLSDDYDFLFLPYYNDDSMRNVLKKNFHRKDISNKEYFRLMLTLDAISVSINKETRFTIWRDIDKILECELDLKPCLDILFKRCKEQDVELGTKFKLLESVIDGTKGLDEDMRQMVMERFITSGLNQKKINDTKRV